MYTLKDKGVISEITCGNNFEYILKDNTIFVNTDYKVLQSQNNGIFVKCMKMTRNGLIDLYYVTDEYRPMASMFVGINADTLVNVVVNLFSSVIEVRNNGFLACQCIDLSWDKIFVEQNTLKVKLIYLPLSVRAFDSYVEFESELRTSIVKLVNKVITTSNTRLDQLVMISRYKNLKVGVIFTNYENVNVSYDAPEPIRNIKQERHLLYFDDLDNLKVFDVAYEDMKANKKRLQLNDAYYIKDNSVVKVKLTSTN